MNRKLLLPLLFVILMAGWLFASFGLTRGVERVFAAKTGQQLSLAGGIRLRFFPSPGIEFGRTALFAPKSATPWLSVERGELSFSLMPLLKGEFQSSGITLDGLRLFIIRNQDGSLNFPAFASGGGAYDIGGLALKNAQLIYRDDASKSKMTLTGISLVTGRIKSGQPVKLSASFPARENSGLAGKMNLSLQSDNSGFSLSDATANLELDREGRKISLRLDLPQARYSGKWLGSPAQLSLGVNDRENSARLGLGLSAWQIDGKRLTGQFLGEMRGRSGKLPFAGKLSSALLLDGDKWRLYSLKSTGDVSDIPFSLAGEISGQDSRVSGELSGLADSADFSLSASDEGEMLHFSGSLARLDADKWLRAKALLPQEEAASHEFKMTGKMKVGKMHYSGAEFSKVTIEMKP